MERRKNSDSAQPPEIRLQPLKKGTCGGLGSKMGVRLLYVVGTAAL